MRVLGPLLGAGLAAAACATAGDDETAVSDDAGAEASIDATADAGRTTRRDAGVDAAGGSDSSVGEDTSTPEIDASDDGFVAPIDAGVDSGVDSGVDAGVDAGVDSGVDAGFDSGVDSGTVTKPAQGEVLISEVMFDSSGTEPDTEWFEVYNTQSTPRLLSGLLITDGAARTHVIASSPAVVIGAQSYGVLVRLKSAASTALIPASAILYEYGTGQTATNGIILSNGSTGSVSLDNGATNVAHAPYGPFNFNQPSPGGKSIQLKTLTYAASGTAASWCLSANVWAVGADKGTPGLTGDCP